MDARSSSRRPIGCVAFVAVLALAVLALFSSSFLLPSRHTAASGPVTPMAPDRDDDDDEEKPRGPRLPAGRELGLALTFERDGVRDTRPARMVALNVPAGTAPTPFLSPGPFRATWEGEVNIPFRGEFLFNAAGRGKLRVEVAGKTVLDGEGEDLKAVEGKPIKVKKGANKLVVTYESPLSGDALVRLAWASEDFRREPINTDTYMHEGKPEALVRGTQLRDGRQLIAEQRCLQCHAPSQPIVNADRMPELATDAPNLADAGARLKLAWMARWIEDPHKLRPSATMPRVVHGPASGDQARDLAAYLATLGTPEPVGAGNVNAEPDGEKIKEGGRLFANLGCIGCHTAPDRDDWSSDPKRVPLRFVGVKWQPRALVGFLLDPDRHYAWIRMPNFHFSPAEAEAVAAYVTSPPAADLGDDQSGTSRSDAGRGRALFASTGCASCHSTSTIPTPSAGSSSSRAIALDRITADGWARGCVASEETPDRRAPNFALPTESVAAIRALALTPAGFDSLNRDAAPEFAERQIRASQCNACHKRDGYDDVWTDHKVEVEKLLADAPVEDKDSDGLPFPADQSRPSLTWTGEKLHADWAETFISGRLAAKPRPYLRARMPAFASRAAGLAHGLALGHGYPLAEPAQPAADPELVPVAQQLVGNMGLNCVSCHNIGKTPAVGVFEAPGINFMLVRERIRFDYFDRWVRSPIRVEPETKMPTYFNGEASVLPTILDGKAEPQVRALWNYLLQGRQIEPPGRP